jgi:hypothetical protein
MRELSWRSKPSHRQPVGQGIGNLADFTTHFSFVIDSQNKTAYGGGLAFFLAPNGSTVPDDITQGGGMGLTEDDQQLNSTNDHFVAVEFDIFSDHYLLLMCHGRGVKYLLLKGKLMKLGLVIILLLII